MTDTLILGGGLAGCAAALWLADHGHSVTIVEARPRLGGRGLSRIWGDAGVVEYGGGWIRSDHRLMIALAARLGVALMPRAPRGARRFFPAAPGDLTPFLTDAARIGQAGAPDLQALSLAAHIAHRALTPEATREIMAWWSISGSGDPAHIAVSELLTAKLATGLEAKLDELAFTLDGGVSSLIVRAAEASGARLILGDPVVALSDHDGVTVTLTSGATLQARGAIVALPLNCLDTLRFDPPLSAAQSALCRAGHRGRALKLLIRAEGPQPGDLATGEAFGLRWFYADRDLPDGSVLVTAFGLQDEVVPLDHDLVQQALAAAFAGARLKGFDWHDWCGDAFSRGTWVSPDIATLPLYGPEHWAPRGSLAFAGSDMYSAEQGWFEGALLTARTAATAIHDRLQKA